MYLTRYAVPTAVILRKSKGKSGFLLMEAPYYADIDIRRVPMAVFDIVLFAVVFAFLAFALTAKIRKITFK